MDLPRFAPRRALFLADFLAEPLRAVFLAELRRADFLAPFLADFFADRLLDFLAPPFLAVFLRARVVRVRAGSSLPSNDDVEDAGAEEGTLSIGSGSIHPEPDQPISI